MTLKDAPLMPASHPILGVFNEFQNDPLNLLERTLPYGDVVRMRFLNRFNYVMNHPDAVQQVLVKQATKFRKDDFIRNAFEPFIGEGLTIAEGDHWKRQRKLIAPAFHTQRIQHYADVMINHTHKLIEDWQRNLQRDIQSDMVQLNSGIIGETLFGEDVSEQAASLREHLQEMNRLFIQRAQQINVPRWVPTKHNRDLDRIVAKLDAIVVPMIDKRRASGEDTGDLLSMLLLSETEYGERMSDKHVRDEAVMLFLAGNDTSSAALTWAFYLLVQHPDVVQKIRDEVDAIAPNRRLGFEDLHQLAYTDAVLKEVQRVYPSAWAFSRECIADAEIMGYRVPAKSVITLSPWVMHHNPAIWDEPQTFNPERFIGQDNRHKYAYFPFGGGQRVCIGSSFASMEMRLVVATLVQHMELIEMLSDAPNPDASLVLQPDKPLVLQVAERTREPQLA